MQLLDLTPLGHDHLELGPRVVSVLRGQRNHLRLVLDHCVDLGPVPLDVCVPGEDEPALLSNDRQPVDVEGAGPDRARRPLSLVDGRAWVAWVGDVRSKRRQNLQSEDVLVDVEPDDGGLHAAEERTLVS